jgi:ketosteroid isomerase-like protein
MRIAPAVLAALLVVAPAARAQHDMHHGPDTAKTAVLSVVRTLFDGMRAGDSAKVRSVFHPNAQLSTAVTRNGVPSITFDSIGQFVRAVGTPHADVWDERTRDEMVHVDNGMAMVWAPYAFYAGSKFSHCGVDSFQLARTTDGWKIIALIDTRQRTGCPEQAAGK